jgi:tRNA nucleotidyltransferase (CCA-adding enzyme)
VVLGSVNDARSVALADRGPEVLAALATLPGGLQLLHMGERREDLALVGGAVRDLLLGRPPRELDVVLDGDAAVLAGELAAMLEEPSAASSTPATVAPRERAHGRFGTAVVEWGGGRIDLAARRAERYAAPGALPDVRAGTREEDLQRRDFTVNAIAIPLGGQRRGQLESPPGALEDLAAGRLRVLHERSFIDDPTRLLRLGRYQARLRFEIEERTAARADEALAAHALASVSGARVGAELRLALGEPEPQRSLQALADLGVLAALDRGIALDRQLARDALELLPADGRPDLLLLAVLLRGVSAGGEAEPRAAPAALLDRFEFPAADRERVLRGALGGTSLRDAIAVARRPSQLHDALAGAPPEAVALAAALAIELEPSARTQVRRAAVEWLERLRHVRLAITGEDLLAAGIPAGPQIGERLAAALRSRLDGELGDGAEAELRAALGRP